MADPVDVLISVRPPHAERIFAGTKTVELRRRRPKIEPGASIWIYETSPVAALKGCARLERIVSDTPAAIWNNLGAWTGLSKAEFEEYFLNCMYAHALLLNEIRILRHPILLDNMRKMIDGFHPPQFFCRLNGVVTNMRLRSRKYDQISG